MSQRRTLARACDDGGHIYAKVAVRAEDANLKTSPVSIALDVVKAPCSNKLPDEDASNKPKCVTVPQEAVAWSNSTAELLDVAPLDGELKAIALRTYEPPDTSVPEPASVGSDVNKPTYTVVGLVYEVLRKTALTNAVSK